MKAILQKVPVSVDCSFAVRSLKSPYFNIPWHFHPEYELVLIIKSEGKRFVGNSIINFFPGDMVLLGSNIPHWYRNDSNYYENDPDLEAESILIQFSDDFIGDAFFNKPETAAIKKVLNRAALGLAVTGETRDMVANMMLEMPYLENMERLIRLLSILNVLSNSSETTVLSTQDVSEVDLKDSARLNKIYEYVITNYTRQIPINEISDLVNMSESTFCRYFKKRTGKTFTYFLNEIRIGHVCKLLIEDDLNITEICFSSGYNNISYFNRQFKNFKKKTPLEFKQAYKAQH